MARHARLRPIRRDARAASPWSGPSRCPPGPGAVRRGRAKPVSKRGTRRRHRCLCDVLPVAQAQNRRGTRRRPGALPCSPIARSGARRQRQAPRPAAVLHTPGQSFAGGPARCPAARSSAHAWTVPLPPPDSCSPSPVAGWGRASVLCKKKSVEPPPPVSPRPGPVRPHRISYCPPPHPCATMRPLARYTGTTFRIFALNRYCHDIHSGKLNRSTASCVRRTRAPAPGQQRRRTAGARGVATPDVGRIRAVRKEIR